MLKSIYSLYQKIFFRLFITVSKTLTNLYFYLNHVEHGKFTSLGVPILNVDSQGKCQFGADVVMVNTAKFSMLGKANRCKFVVMKNGKLQIGKKVAMSNATIIASLSVQIGNNIMIGGGTTIVDTDFHSFNPDHWHTSNDALNMKSEPVIINDNVFIGMDSVILKGVTIGSNVIIAARSVITKDIPPYQIWGGNPAKFIRNND